MMAKPYVVFAVVFGVALRARNAAKSFATHSGGKADMALLQCKCPLLTHCYMSVY
jgi:hypothetical protein